MLELDFDWCDNKVNCIIQIDTWDFECLIMGHWCLLTKLEKILSIQSDFVVSSETQPIHCKIYKKFLGLSLTIIRGLIRI